MTQAKVLIVGAAGQTGKHILKALIQEKDTKWSIQAGIFTEEGEEQERSLQKFEGLEKVRLDWHNLEQLATHMRDVDELILIPPPKAEKIAVMMACIQAAHKARSSLSA